MFTCCVLYQNFPQISRQMLPQFKNWPKIGPFAWGVASKHHLSSTVRRFSSFPTSADARSFGPLSFVRDPWDAGLGRLMPWLIGAVFGQSMQCDVVCSVRLAESTTSPLFFVAGEFGSWTSRVAAWMHRRFPLPLLRDVPPGKEMRQPAFVYRSCLFSEQFAAPNYIVCKN
jgi:hypothetical protein